jgi:hypothetical protein
MADEQDPPVRKLVLKPKEVVTPTDTVSRPGDGTEISVQLIHKQNAAAEERAAIRMATHPPVEGPDVDPAPAESTVFAPKEFTRTDTPSIPGDGTAISASLILQENRINEQKYAPEVIAMPPRRRSKRKRDFILMVTVGILLVGGLLLVIPKTVGSLTLAVFFIVFFSAVLAWIMFGVMDDY